MSAVCETLFTSIQHQPPYLELFVLLLQLAAQLLKFLPHGDRLAQLGSALVFFLLELLGAFLRLDMFTIESSHVSKQVAVFLLQDVNARKR